MMELHERTERIKGKKYMSQIYHHHKKLTLVRSEENSIGDNLAYLKVICLDLSNA